MSSQATSLWRLAQYENGFPFKPDDFGPTGTPVIRIRQLVDSNAEVDLTERLVPARYLLNEGDLVFSWSGSLAVTTWNRGPAWLNQHLFKVIPAVDVDRSWLRWAIEASIPRFEGLMHGSAMTHLTLDMLKQLKVDAPPLDEQRRIANFLDAETAFTRKIEALRSQQREQLEKRRWSLLQDLIESSVREDLPLRRLLHSVTDGPFGSAFSSSDYADHGAAVVRLGNIGFAEYRPQDQAYIPMYLFREFGRYNVNEGDILIAGLGDPRNHAGRACIAPNLGPAIVKGKCFRARAVPGRASAEFITLMLSSPIGASALEGRGSTRSMINLEIFKSAVLPIPRYSDQVTITAEMNHYWQSALTAIRACDRQLALLAERRQALITAAVTGEISV